jgi:UDP-3-O-[3-hydroxymyristoyl] glucosamine N-acyltransferase LpxD
VVIGADVTIGEDCLIHAHVSIRERVVIGNRVVVQDGAVIGSDGFGFARRRDGTHRKIPQIGGVVIEDDVEIGALTAVDRPALGETRIASGTKIDNLVQVAHGVSVGRNALLVAQSGVAGSSALEDNVILAGQAGVAGHVRVGRNTRISARAVVTGRLQSNRTRSLSGGGCGSAALATVLLRGCPSCGNATRTDAWSPRFKESCVNSEHSDQVLISWRNVGRALRRATAERAARA